MAEHAIPAHADDLTETLAEAFRLLSRGVADRRHPFHTPVLASLGADGAAEARSVVLRGFDPGTRTLRLHTDARSAKVAGILADPRVCLLAYDPGGRVQLRLSGQAVLHRDDAVADGAWAATRDFSRLIYAIDPAPGTPVPNPPAAPRQEARARDNFAVLALGFDRLDWLWLAAIGHRRARFEWPGPGPRPAATWLVP